MMRIDSRRLQNIYQNALCVRCAKGGEANLLLEALYLRDNGAKLRVCPHLHAAVPDNTRNAPN